MPMQYSSNIKQKSESNRGVLNTRPEIWLCLVIVCSIFAVYWQVHTFSSISYDTPEYVFDNNHVKAGLTLKNIRWAFTTTYFSNWHPLTWLSHMMDVELYGLNPGQHKLNNVLFHIINTLLLFFLLKKITDEILPSALVSFLFALHPLHIQSIVWIAERKDLLSALFFFLAIFAYLFYLEKKSIPRYALTLFFFSLGLMAKPMIITLPAILFLLDFWPLGRFPLIAPITKNSIVGISPPHETVKSILFEKIPFLILAAISGFITIYAQKIGGSVVTLAQLPIQERVANSLVSYLLYLYKVICPIELAIIYPHPTSHPLWLVIAATLILGGFSCLIFARFRKSPFLIIGWLWFLVMLIPVIGFIQVGVQALADRYMYLPIIGLFIIFSWGLFHQLKKHTKRPEFLFSLLGSCLLLILMIVSWWQLQFWKDGEVLFARATAITDKNYVAYNNLGYELIQKFKYEEAKKQFKTSLQIEPNFEIAHLNLGRSLIEEEQYDDGIAHYKTAIKIKPDYADAHNNLANVMLRLGKNHEAAYHYLQVLRINPSLIEVYNNLGVILVSDQKFDEAIVLFQKALELNPVFLEAKMNLEKTIVVRSQQKKL